MQEKSCKTCLKSLCKRGQQTSHDNFPFQVSLPESASPPDLYSFSGDDFLGGKVVSGDDSWRGKVNSGVDSWRGNMNSGVDSWRGNINSGVDPSQVAGGDGPYDDRLSQPHVTKRGFARAQRALVP